MVPLSALATLTALLILLLLALVHGGSLRWRSSERLQLSSSRTTVRRVPIRNGLCKSFVVRLLGSLPLLVRCEAGEIGLIRNASLVGQVLSGEVQVRIVPGIPKFSVSESLRPSDLCEC